MGSPEEMSVVIYLLFIGTLFGILRDFRVLVSIRKM